MFDYTYPHTNLSDINLDWFLKRFSELEAELEEIQNRMTQAEQDIQTNAAAIAALQNSFNDLMRAFDSFIAEVNTRFANLETTLRAEINAAIANMQSQFDALRAEIEAELDALRAEIAADFATFQTEIRASLQAMQTEIENFKIEIRGQLANLLVQAKLYTDEVAAILQAEIDELQDLGVHTDVTDPTDRHRKHLQPALDRMHEYLRAWALTAGEYDGLELSAATYDGENLTAYEYDYRGKWHLIDRPAIIELIPVTP